MNIGGCNSCGSVEQMQMRKMDGKGGGGMKDIMQNLSTEDQAVMKEQMSSMSMDERMSMVSQMKEIDKSNMSDEEYTQTLLDILNQADTNTAEEEGFSVYV